jgi:hypothetical protein
MANYIERGFGDGTTKLFDTAVRKAGTTPVVTVDGVPAAFTEPNAFQILFVTAPPLNSVIEFSIEDGAVGAGGSVDLGPVEADIASLDGRVDVLEAAAAVDVTQLATDVSQLRTDVGTPLNGDPSLVDAIAGLIGDTSLMNTDIGTLQGDLSNLTMAHAKTRDRLLDAPTGVRYDDSDVSSIALAWSDVTRTLTLSPTNVMMTWYVLGEKYTSLTDITITVPDVTGNYYVYADTDGVIKYGTSVWDLHQHAPIAFIHWSAVTQKAMVLSEMHHAGRDINNHIRLHSIDGTQAGAGYAISGYTLNTNGDAAIQFAVAQGTVYDEDLATVSANPAQAAGSNYALMYRAGALGDWVVGQGNSVPLWFSAGPVPNVNTFAASTWGLEAVANNRFFNYYAFAVPSIAGKPGIVLVPGQATYSNLSLANAESVANLQLGSLPFPEMAPLYQLTFEYRTAYTGSTRARLQAVTRIIGTKASITATSTTDHGSLAGLADDDHTQYPLTVGTRPTINVGTPADGEVLKYSTATGTWVNAADGGGSGGAAVTELKWLLGGEMNGLELLWVDATHVSVMPGACAVNLDVTMANAKTANIVYNSAVTALTMPTLANSTWYHVYTYADAANNGVDPLMAPASFEVSTTVPVQIGAGMYWTKTGNSARRYIGSFKTEGTGLVLKFLQEGNKVYWSVQVSVLSVTTWPAFSSPTTVSVSVAVPPSGYAFDANVSYSQSSDSGATYLGLPGFTSPTVCFPNARTSGWFENNTLREVPVNASLQYTYGANNALTNGGGANSLNMLVNAYRFAR